MKKLEFLLSLLMIILNISSGLAQGLGIYHERYLNIGSDIRLYLLYEPIGHTGTEEWPLVFNFHGFHGDVADQVSGSEMYKVADTAKFFVVYPQGLVVQDLIFGGAGSGWNVPFAYSAPHDDIVFINAIIDDLIDDTEFAIDTNRIHATGISNGGEMTYYLACALSDRIASMAGVAAQMTYVMMDSICTPDRMVSVLHMLGTLDPVFPVGGNSYFPPLEGTAEYWAGIDGCDPEPTIQYLPDIDPGDQSTVTLKTYPSCVNGFEVLCYRIEGGQHSWPGGGQVGSPGVNNDINASVEIWNFFKRNPHPRSYPFCLSGGVSFTSQQEIDDFQLFHPNCVTIEGDVEIKGADITDLSGLNQLELIEGDLSFLGNDSLEDLTGLENLDSIEGGLYIGKDLSPWGTSGNNVLLSLTGLEGLTSIGGELFIGFNDALTSLSGLDNIAPGSISELYIYDNASLSGCEVQSVCDYLASLYGVIEIHDNATGCDSQEEVEEACGIAGINESAVVSHQSSINIFPNPSTNIITIELHNITTPPKNTILTMYNINGQQIITQLIIEAQTLVDLSGLTSGIYVLKVMNDKDVVVQKVVKQ